MTGFKAEGFKSTGPSAASFTVWCLGGAAGFARAARFGEETCFGDLPGFDELLKTSDSQPALLAWIGTSTNAAIAAMMVRRRYQTPKPDPANFLPDDGNLSAPQSDFRSRLMTAQDDPDRDYEP